MEKKLRSGFTTGSCAAAASKAAAWMLLTGEEKKSMRIFTPSGRVFDAEILDIQRGIDSVKCAVRKDGGDDPDVTTGALIYSEVRLSDAAGVRIDGGEGVGRVTRPGLDQPPGEAAVNSVPRSMIRQELADVAEAYSYDGGFDVVISVPGGEEIASRTFNPRLGIEGGISIIGTTGIVEPRSLKALKDALEVEIRYQAAQGHTSVIVTPGNYGETFAQSLKLPPDPPLIKCANFIGDTLDCVAINGFKNVLLIGHIGKLVKVAGSIMDTQSRMADCRREIFAAHAAWCGASTETVHELFDSMTTDACIRILDDAGLRDAVIDRIASAVQSAVEHRVGEFVRIGVIIFSNVYGLLAVTTEAQAIIDDWNATGTDASGEANDTE